MSTDRVDVKLYVDWRGDESLKQGVKELTLNLRTKFNEHVALAHDPPISLKVTAKSQRVLPPEISRTSSDTWRRRDRLEVFDERCWCRQRWTNQGTLELRRAAFSFQEAQPVRKTFRTNPRKILLERDNVKLEVQGRFSLRALKRSSRGWRDNFLKHNAEQREQQRLCTWGKHGV